MDEHGFSASSEDTSGRREAARRRIAERHERTSSERRVPLPEDAELVVYDPKFCLGCGEELSELPADVTQCPRCGRGFEPNNPSSYAEEPPPTLERNWWLQTPRLAGYGLLASYIVGRLVINFFAPGVATGFAGQTGSTIASGAIGAVVTAIGVLLIIPWLFVSVYLALMSIEEHFGPKVLVTVLLGAGFGLLLTLGLHPAFLFVGVVTGGFTGFFYAWRAI